MSDLQESNLGTDPAVSTQTTPDYASGAAPEPMQGAAAPKGAPASQSAAAPSEPATGFIAVQTAAVKNTAPYIKKEQQVAHSAQPVFIQAANPLRLFVADTTDACFALVFSLVGYFYIISMDKFLSHASRGLSPFTPQLWLFPLFVCAYAAAVLGYFYAQKKAPSKESWLWLGVLLALGVPLPFYSVAPMFQLLLLHLVALYWPLCAAGALLCGGKTGAALPYDAINAGLLVPWGNFFSHIRVLGKNLSRRVVHTRAGSRVAFVGLGLVLAVPVLMIVMPLLASADASFAHIFNNLERWFDRWIETSMAVFWWQIILSLPVTCILYGAVYGALHRRCTDCFHAEGLHAMRERARIVPTTAAATMFCVLGAVYVLFLVLQGSYVFGAFMGHLPENFSYSAYAREGFFELCRLGGVNLAVLTVSNLVCRTPRRENRVLRICNVALCVLSLLLTGTAAAKLGMYIAAYGLTVNRVLPAVFLLWMAVVFVALLVWQVRSFSVVRFAVLTLAVMVAITCAADVPDLCVVYNQARWRSGTLQEQPDYNASYDAWNFGTYGMYRGNR